ncbi:RICIN domain-containing protein [Streptomyces sp. NA04227]|uniref:RICIN domain-containing protein n=1 Tax=Streptomyces sp. NA04227 TaxID=2742136 RepID=UPI0015906398|nr:RICIN domain-containing protein [Streptomyces sp. NA04227]QKW07516.1 RICIN domain-containing protein [Streptomyces sp. NA04227]
MPSPTAPPDRRTLISAVALTVGAVVLAAAPTPAAAGAAGATAGTTYYVSPDGEDTGPGSSANPFKTIQKCADVAVGGDTCLIRSGTYRETVTPRVSGSADAPVTFASEPGADVTVDGTDTVTGWSLDSGSIYKAKVTLAGTADAPYSSTQYPSNEDLWANQVFTSGALVPEAAFPAASSDPWDQSFITGGWSSTRSGSGETCATPPCTAVLSGTLTYDDFPDLGDMTGATVYMAGSWVANSASVTKGDLSGGNKVLDLSFPGSDGHVSPGGNSTKFRLVGKKSLLRGPNAWYYDAGAKELFMWAPDGKAPTDITAKKRNYGFNLNDRSHITVRGIKLFATSLTTDDNSTHNVLDGIKAEYLSTWQTSQYDTGLPYAGVYDANHHFDSGILLHGADNTVRNSTLRYSMGNGISVKGSGHVIDNNLISDVAYGGTYTAAVALEVGANGVEITHNTMRSTGRDVVNMNTNAYPNAGYKNLRIAYNDMYDFAKINFDLGAVYTCCNTAYTGTRMDHNWIHDSAQIANGFHFDNGSYDVNVDHNVAWNLRGGTGISHGGFTQSGKDLPYLTGSIVNNTFVTGSGSTIFNYYADASHVANTVLRNNILDGAHPDGRTYDYLPGGTPDESHSLVTTRSLNGKEPDPQYTAADKGDYSIRSTSPAVDAGTPVDGLTDGYVGAAPDLGAYESGQTPWVPGCDFTGCEDGGRDLSTLVSKSSDKCLDIPGGSVTDGAAAVQWTCGPQLNQRFTVADQGNGYVKLINLNSGRCLDVADASDADGAAVVQWACGNQTNQQWKLTETGDGYRQVISRSSGKCLDVSGNSSGDGAPLVQWTCGGEANQQWKLRGVS